MQRDKKSRYCSQRSFKSIYVFANKLLGTKNKKKMDAANENQFVLILLGRRSDGETIEI
jgi:hypothetical protein